MPKSKTKGLLASEMGVKDLRELAVSFKLYTAKEAAKKDKKALLAAIKKHEDKLLNEKRAGLKKVGAGASTANVQKPNPELGLHEGKKVISKTPIKLNGKDYTDILVESGETYRVLNA